MIEAMPSPGADSIISSDCGAISGFPGEERRRCRDMRAACRSSPRPPDERRREYSGRRSCRSPYQILGVQGCRGHTISEREFNLFKPLRRHLPASAKNSLSPEQILDDQLFVSFVVDFTTKLAIGLRRPPGMKRVFPPPPRMTPL